MVLTGYIETFVLGHSLKNVELVFPVDWECVKLSRTDYYTYVTQKQAFPLLFLEMMFAKFLMVIHP